MVWRVWWWLGCGGSVDIQGDESEQFLVAHFSEHFLAAAFKQFVGKRALSLDDLVDAFLDGAPAYELMHQHIVLLADAESAVGGLVFDGGVPPAVEVDDMEIGR